MPRARWPWARASGNGWGSDVAKNPPNTSRSPRFGASDVPKCCIEVGASDFSGSAVRATQINDGGRRPKCSSAEFGRAESIRWSQNTRLQRIGPRMRRPGPAHGGSSGESHHTMPPTRNMRLPSRRKQGGSKKSKRQFNWPIWIFYEGASAALFGRDTARRPMALDAPRKVRLTCGRPMVDRPTDWRHCGGPTLYRDRVVRLGRMNEHESGNRRAYAAHIRA